MSAGMLVDTLSPYIAPAIETNVAVYGGIYRTVSLSVLDPIHIAENGMWVTKPTSFCATAIAGTGRHMQCQRVSSILQHRSPQGRRDRTQPSALCLQG